MIFLKVQTQVLGEAIVRKPATAETRYTFLDHRTDFFDFELLAGENKVPVGFEDEAIDTFVNDKMMPMSFQSPWVAVEYMCRIYGLKNDDFIDLEFDWEPYKCPGFDAALNQVCRRFFIILRHRYGSPDESPTMWILTFETRFRNMESKHQTSLN